VPETEVRSPKSYLSAVVTRLSIDRLRSARALREEYVGPWLPGPLVSNRSEEPADPAELDESLSMAYLVLLESLNAVERAVFLLREVFDYEETPSIVGKGEDNCRQIARRARQAVAARRPRFEHSPEQERRLTEQFVEACVSGNMEGLVGLLSEDVTDAVLSADRIEGVILRYGMFYGPGTWYGKDGDVGRQVRKRRYPMIGKGDGVFSFIHVSDAATATVAALERARPGVYNVVDDEPARAAEWMPVYAEALGAKPPARVPAFIARLLAGEP